MINVLKITKNDGIKIVDSEIQFLNSLKVDMTFNEIGELGCEILFDDSINKSKSLNLTFGKDIVNTFIGDIYIVAINDDAEYISMSNDLIDEIIYKLESNVIDGYYGINV